MKNALVFGYYGYDNLGDELLCQATINLLKKARFDRIYLLVPKNRIKDYQQKHIHSINRFDPISIINAILRSNYVICGGGGIFQDQTSLRSFIYYSSIVGLSIFFGKPVILLANSLGPVKRRLSRMILRYLLSRKKVYFIARDCVSARYAKRFSKNVFDGTDLAPMALENNNIEIDRKPQATFCLKSPTEIHQIMSFLRHAGVEKFVLAPLSPQDQRLSWNLSKKYPEIELSNNPIQSIASSSIVISQRMHGCLISAYFGVPFIAINNSKATRFMKKYLPNYEGYTTEEPSSIAIAIARVMGKPVDVRERMLSDSKKMEEQFMRLLRFSRR